MRFSHGLVCVSMLVGCSNSSDGTVADLSANVDLGPASDQGSGAPDAVPPPVDEGPPPDLSPPPDTCKGTALTGVYTADPKLCVVSWATGVSGARQMAFAPNGDLYVSAGGKVVVLYDSDGDGTSSASERFNFATASGLNHGVALSPDHAWVYASSDTTVYRWPYTGTHTASTATAEVVVKNIPGAGAHVTRTLLFDSTGTLIVSVGSANNVDTMQTDFDTRAQLRSFVLPSTIPSGGVDYGTGTVVAHGLRNEVGLTYDRKGNLWGVENGRDNLSDPDINSDIHNDNPGEEVNLLNSGGVRYYGYPLCWSENMLPSGGLGPTTQWADQSPEVPVGIRMTDVECRDATKVQKPKAVMPAHWAPLGVVEYTGAALPWAGDLFVTSHGSWDRTPATGRVVARAHIDSSGAVASVTPIVGELYNGMLRQGVWSLRPVDIRQGPDQALYVSDDQGGNIIRIGYKP